MIVARLKPDGQSFHYASIDITPEQNSKIRCGINIINELHHLVDWEREYLILGIIPKPKMTIEEYFLGFNYTAFFLHSRNKEKTQKP